MDFDVEAEENNCTKGGGWGWAKLVKGQEWNGSDNHRHKSWVVTLLFGYSWLLFQFHKFIHSFIHSFMYVVAIPIASLIIVGGWSLRDLHSSFSSPHPTYIFPFAFNFHSQFSWMREKTRIQLSCLLYEYFILMSSNFENYKTKFIKILLMLNSKHKLSNKLKGTSVGLNTYIKIK